MHHHFHIAGRKGDSWESLFSGADALAFEKALAGASGNIAFDEVRGFSHLSPSLSRFPKQLAVQRANAEAGVRARSKEDLDAEADRLAEANRANELRQAEHAIAILRASVPLTPADAQAKKFDPKKHDVELNAAIAKRDGIIKAHAELAQQKLEAAQIAAHEKQIAEAEAALAALKSKSPKKK